MKKGFSVIILGILTLLFIQCAKRGTPEGGEKDITPPEFLRASPENYSTNFNAEEIRINFDEYIRLEKPQEQIIVSPPMTPAPDILPLGSPSRRVTIGINDTLEENTTYTINFGRSIVDNNEGNPLPFFKYIFSTGDYIDSLAVSGTVSDARLREPDPFVSVMLYEMDEDYTDSLIYNQPPKYITSTLDSVNFELANLKEGTYRLVAIQDLNNNYNFNPAREKIGFIEDSVTIPTDETYNLVMFREVLPFEPERPRQESQQKLLIGYQGRAEPESLEFSPIDEVPADFDYTVTKVEDKDSLYFWYKPQLETDSLRLQLTSPNRIDTLTTRITELPKDSLSVSIEPSGTLDIGRDVIFKATTPIVSKSDELFSILDQDSVAVEFTSELVTFENTVRLKFDIEENQNYQITALPGAITDFFDSTNDTIQRSLKTKAFSDYGNLTVNLQNVENFPVIVQLTDEQGEVKAEQYSTGETTLRFSFLPPAEYYIRVVYDRNENGRWDTGDFLQKIQPEEIIYFPEVMEVRPNWDINQDFSLN